MEETVKKGVKEDGSEERKEMAKKTGKGFRAKKLTKDEKRERDV